MDWKKHLTYDPIPQLLNCGFPEIVYFTKRELLGEDAGSAQTLWEFKEPQKIVNKQQSDGSWRYPNPKVYVRGALEYNQVETLRQLGFLIEEYGFTNKHPAIQKAKDFVFSSQSGEGDIRGIYWNQYSPNYTACFLELFIKSGYKDDAQVKKALNWLLSIRQDDGGWAIPIRTHEKDLSMWMSAKEPFQPDRTKPFSYMATGVVLRAFATLPQYRDDAGIHKAAELVLTKLFKRDNYPDRSTPEFWTKFTFPAWYTDLISILDVMSKLGFSPEHPKIKEGIEWFRKRQKKDGTWELYSLKGKQKSLPYWHDLNVCRIFKQFYE